MAFFASITAMLAAGDGILPSTVQSARLQRPLCGHCAVHKGIVRVGFWAGSCHGFGSADVETGWNSVARIYVEEVPPPQA